MFFLKKDLYNKVDVVRLNKFFFYLDKIFILKDIQNLKLIFFAQETKKKFKLKNVS